jgi:putative spermidine/putrescine transport system permease protein
VAERPGGRRLSGIALGATLALVAIVPILSLVVQAAADEWRAPAPWPQRLGTRGVEIAFSDTTGAIAAIQGSLVVGVATTLIAIAIGWPAARLIGERGAARTRIVWLALALPLLVPPFAIGSGLAEWLIRFGIADSYSALVIAHLVPVVPYVVLVLASAFTPDLRALEEVAEVHGAGPLTRIRLVTLPAIGPTLTVAALLGFLVSWSQYGLSLAVGGGTPMLPLLLVPFVDTDPQVAAVLALVFLAPTLLALLVTARVLAGARSARLAAPPI